MVALLSAHKRMAVSIHGDPNIEAEILNPYNGYPGIPQKPLILGARHVDIRLVLIIP